MTTFKLITAIEAIGATFVIGPSGILIVPPAELSPSEQVRFGRLLSQVRENSAAVTAWIREREAAQKWERSGKNLSWWRQP